jgi:2-methylcitrate dehydratase PrpD
MNDVNEPAVPVTEQLAEFAICSDLGDAAPDLLHAATRAFIDTIGVAIAGASDISVNALVQSIDPTWTPPGSGAVCLGTGYSTTPVHAALINGTAGHALDFDDHLSEVNGHPSVVLVPALLALGQSLNVSGRQVLEAYIVGHQVMCAISAALPVRPHWQAGWHATGTIGVMGAAAACSRLLGLTIPETRVALGIAASFAAGSRQNCGYTVKPLHAGMATSNGLLAARLAQGGYTADPGQLEAPLGFFKVFGVNPDLSKIQKILAEPWSLQQYGLNVKQFPACYAVHPAANAAVRIARSGVKAGEIAKIKVTVQPTGLVGPIHKRPETGLQAKFSMEYTVAAALLDQKLGLETYEDHSVLRPQAQELLKKVQTAESEFPPEGPADFEKWFAVVEVTSEDGDVMTARADMPHGYGRDPLSDQELDAKFLECTSVPGSVWNGPELLSRLWDLAGLKGLRDLFLNAAEDALFPGALETA